MVSNVLPEPFAGPPQHGSDGDNGDEKSPTRGEGVEVIAATPCDADGVIAHARAQPEGEADGYARGTNDHGVGGGDGVSAPVEVCDKDSALLLNLALTLCIWKPFVCEIAEADFRKIDDTSRPSKQASRGKYSYYQSRDQDDDEAVRLLFPDTVTTGLFVGVKDNKDKKFVCAGMAFDDASGVERVVVLVYLANPKPLIYHVPLRDSFSRLDVESTAMAHFKWPLRAAVFPSDDAAEAHYKRAMRFVVELVGNLAPGRKASLARSGVDVPAEAESVADSARDDLERLEQVWAERVFAVSLCSP